MACDPCTNNDALKLSQSSFITASANAATVRSNAALSQRLLEAFVKLLALVTKTVFASVEYLEIAAPETTFALPTTIDLNDARIVDFYIEVNWNGLQGFTDVSAENPWSLNLAKTHIVFGTAIPAGQSITIDVSANELIETITIDV